MSTPIIETKFIKFSKGGHIPKWRQYFTGAGAWLEVLEILMDNKDRLTWGRFYAVQPTIMFCVELYIKAIASYTHKKIKASDYGHDTVKVLNDLSDKIFIFKKIKQNDKLFGLIKEYQKTIYNTRFGETSVSINGEDEAFMIKLAYDLNKEMCVLSGLRG